MTKLFPPKWSSKLRSFGIRLILYLTAGYCVVLLTSLGLLFVQINQFKHQLATDQLTLAQTKLRQLNRTARWTNVITAYCVPDLRLIQSATDLGQTVTSILANFSQATGQNQTLNLTGLTQVLQIWADQSDDIVSDLNRSWLITKWLKPEELTQINSVAQDLSAASPTLTKLLSDSTKILVVFQNRNELRAGGGFMGSYLLLTIDRGRVTDYVLEDIYDTDGQFTGFVPAPAGVKQYLSSDRGLRLPDANWASEFSQAGPTILSYFSLGKRTDIDLLIAINQRPLSELLSQTGPLPLPDYQTELRSDNLDLVLQDRGEFFPGSRAKTQLLTSAFTQLKDKVTTGTVPTNLLVEIFSQAVQKKDILFFSPHPDLQNLLSELRLTGDINSPSLISPLYLLESNVGINKTNPWIKREVILTPEPDKLRVTINWRNTTSTSSQNYVNYQRLVVPATWTVTQVLVNGQSVSHLDQEQISLDNGLVATQLGFLVTVPGQGQSTAQIELKIEPDLHQLYLIAQPGQEPYPVTIQSTSTTQNLLLDRDLVVSW